MSGPKVVHVRTREERVAECLSAIDNLRASIEQCEGFARHHDHDNTDRMRKRSALLNDLETRAHAGSFDAVLQTCAQMLAEVDFEREELERTVLESAASEAARRRRTTLLAESLARRLESKGLPIPAELSFVLNLSSRMLNASSASYCPST
jgi:Mg2+ and Co2+ transporter CorA